MDATDRASCDGQETSTRYSDHFVAVMSLRSCAKTAGEHACFGLTCSVRHCQPLHRSTPSSGPTWQSVPQVLDHRICSIDALIWSSDWNRLRVVITPNLSNYQTDTINASSHHVGTAMYIGENILTAVARFTQSFVSNYWQHA
jgi:hypothetical protein